MRSAQKRFEVRKNRTRSKIAKTTDKVRLSVFKSGQHIYAQIIDDKTSSTLAAASTLEKDIRQKNKSNCNVKVATKIGELIGKRAAKAGIKTVVFDRSGYKFHGVVKAVADAARTNLEF